MNDMTAMEELFERYCEVANNCLAETGYPAAFYRDQTYGLALIKHLRFEIPDEIIYRAIEIARRTVVPDTPSACFDCWRTVKGLPQAEQFAAIHGCEHASHNPVLPPLPPSTIRGVG